MQVSKIEQELLEVSCLKGKRKEERQDYLIRLMKKVADLPDLDWENLSQEAKDWNDNAAKNYNEGIDIYDFPDFEDDGEKDVEFEADFELSQEPPKRRMSACHQVRLLVVRKPWISVAELSAEVKQRELKLTDVTIATWRSSMRDMLRVLNEEGLGNFQLTAPEDSNNKN
jgi:hypothetical protein